MKLNDQQLTELKALADAATPGPWWSGECVPADGHALAWLGNMFVDCNGGQKNYAEPSHDAEFIAASREAIPALIADLKEVQRELENERARGIHSCHDNCTQDGCVNRRLHEELNTTRKQLAEAQALNAQVLSVAEKMRCAGGAQEFQHWFDELKLFLLSKPDTSAIDAAIVEAINDEKRNPWKRAIIEGLIVSHILNATHETDPVRALADLIDWECKETLDPAVSEEARGSVRSGGLL